MECLDEFNPPSSLMDRIAYVSFKLSLIFNVLFLLRPSDNVKKFIVGVDVFVSKAE